METSARPAWQGATAAFGLMAAGQATAAWLQGHAYGEPGFTLALLPWLAGLLAVLIAIAREGGGWAAAGFSPIRPSTLPAVALLGVLLVAPLLYDGAGLLAGPASRWQSADPWRLAPLLVVCVLVAATEEVAFRGLVQTRLVQLHGPLVAILASSLLFSLYHALNLIGGLPVEAVLRQMAGSLLLGGVLGVLAWRLGNIAPVIVVHALYGATIATLGYLRSLGGDS